MKKPLAAACLAVLVALGACASGPDSYHVQPQHDPRQPELIASAGPEQGSQQYLGDPPVVGYLMPGGGAQPSAPTYALPASPDAPAYRPSQMPQPSADIERTVDTIRLHVDGMTCPVRCPREIKAMLKNVPGIIGDPAVDVPSQTVLVNVPHGMNPQPIVDAITSPYRARLL